ncbi:hypothetical protein FLLO111716_01110 [Flavobacterium longum]|uniref:hypothetical protein n=1 Tax=Flavobacterium longum TaxID=1299340 RepID=UPI0039EA0D55
MKLTDAIPKLLNHHFRHYRKSYPATDISDVATLLQNNVVLQNPDRTYSINFDSAKVNETLLEIARNLLSKPLPDDIEDAFGYIAQFKDGLKIYASNAPINAYSDLIKGLRNFVLLRSNQGTDVYDFLFALLISNKKRPNHLLSFESAYFHFLPVSGYPTEIIFKSCCEVMEKNKDRSSDVYKFALAIGGINVEMGIDLFAFGMHNDILQFPGFAPNILIGLYNAGNNGAFSLAESLIEKDVIEGLKAFAGFDFKTSVEIQAVSKIATSISEEPNVIKSKSWLICKILNSAFCPVNLRDENLEKLHKLIASENQEIAHAVFENVMFALENYEDEKYEMLISYLNNTQNFKVFENFFYRIKNPKYLFGILVDLYQDKGFRISIDRFEHSILNYWSESQTETENLILSLFEERNLSFLAVKIMLAGHGHPLPIDVTKLVEENAQLNAVESLCEYPHSIEKLVPIALDLRKSKFKSVREYLQQKLEHLIFNTYHESLLKIAENKLSPIGDKKLLQSLRNALESYKKMREFKVSVKDLDPRENEQDLMDLYYRLEHENQATLMKNTKKDGFLSMLRDVVVVRGKAFKSDDDKQIVPLQLIQSSVLINGDAYKNPLAFERKLENL